MCKNILTNKELKSVLTMIKYKKNETCFVINPFLGKVCLPYGTYGDIRSPNNAKGGYGYEHIIQKRYECDRLNADELTGLILATLEKAKTICPIYWGYNRYLIKDHGIVLVIQKDIFSQGNTWIITTYPDQGKSNRLKKAARDSIQSVIDCYRYSSFLSGIREKIVALTTDIDIVRQTFNQVNQAINS